MDPEAVIDRYDEQWDARHSGPLAIQGYLDAQNLSESAREDVLLELIQTDIERSWIDFRRWLKMQGDTPATAQEALERLHNISGFSDYSSLFQDRDAYDRTSLRLANFELGIRNTHGDAISPALYRERFGLQVDCIAPDEPVILQVQQQMSGDRQRNRTSFVLRGCSRIGRQRSTGPSAPACIEDAEGSRVYLGSLNSDLLSRQHMTVQLLTPNHVAIICDSQKNGVEIQFEVLRPQESKLCRLPLRMKVYSTVSEPIDLHLGTRRNSQISD